MGYLEAVKKLVDQRYTHVPLIDSYKYLQFIALSQVYFIEDIVGKDWHGRVFFDARCDTAYTDKNNIGLTPNILKKDWFGTISNLDFDTRSATNLSVTMLNGFLLHESMHIIVLGQMCDEDYFQDAIDTLSRKFQKTIVLSNGQKSLLQGIWNLVEDVYVNEYARLNYANKAVFLDTTLHFLFSKDKALAAWEIFKANPNPAAAFNVWLNYSNPSPKIINESWYAAFTAEFEILDRVATLAKDEITRKTVDFRKEAVIELFLTLVDLSQEENDGCEQGEDQEESGNGEQGNEQGDSGNSNEENDDDDGDGNSEKSNGNDDGLDGLNDGKHLQNNRRSPIYDGVFNKELSKAEIYENKKLADEINKTIEKVMEEIKRQKDDLSAKLALKEVESVPVLFSDVMDEFVASDNQLIPDREFYKLGTIMRVARENKKFGGIQRNEGTIINKMSLHRIITDDKIFQKKDAKKKKTGNPEVIFLIDVSGSTMWGSSRNKSLLDNIIEATMGSFESLQKAKVPCSVYAHTTRNRNFNDDGDCSVIYGVAAFEMPLMNSKTIVSTPNWRERFNTLIFVDHNANADGTAIDFVSKRFTKRDGTKIVIVLSDGRPTLAPIGCSADNSEYARIMVEAVRKQNIGVVSISLKSDVVSNNNKIYGEKFNVPAFQNLNDNMRRLVREIAL